MFTIDRVQFDETPCIKPRETLISCKVYLVDKSERCGVFGQVNNDTENPHLASVFQTDLIMCP